MASGIYPNFKLSLMNKLVNLSNGGDTINCALLTSSFSFNTANTTWSDTGVSSNEITNTSGAAYVARGQALTSLSTSLVSTTAVFTAANAVWTTASFSTAFAVLLDETYQISGSPSLICAFDFGGTLTVSANTFTISWSASGIINLL